MKTPTHCRALLAEASRYLDGDLRPGRRRAIERHIAECHDCAGCVSTLREILRACRHFGSAPVPAAVRARARRRVRTLLAATASSRR